MKLSALASAAGLLPLVTGAPSAKPIILRNLAVPRYFGAAANTTFLFNDKNYTEVISTQVSQWPQRRRMCMRVSATDRARTCPQFSIFTPENESEFVLRCAGRTVPAVADRRRAWQ